MGEVISEAFPRIKFKTNRVAFPDVDDSSTSLESPLVREELQALGELTKYLEDIGIIPILNDGLVAGNCSMAFEGESGLVLYVSPSGKPKGCLLSPDDFVRVSNFNRDNWSVSFSTKSDDKEPTSDTPLHFSGLLGWDQYGFKERPCVAIHAHALATGPGLEAAKDAGIPISDKETLFSTRDDLDALEKLFKEYPFPGTSCYIRKGHGFIMLAKDIRHATYYFNTVLEPLIVTSRNVLPGGVS
eukprot:jgi/Picsp_1/696/NSC_00690-R1_hypothetical protein VOLCADRAFT_106561 [Volvox carteri f. nagariensis]